MSVRKKWIHVNINLLEKRILDRIFKLYEITYKEIGLIVKDIFRFKEKYKLVWLIDLDSDIDPDAFIIYRETQFGNKIALIGHDGRRQSKEEVKRKFVSLLKKRDDYYYAEVSDNIFRILKNRGVRPIKRKSTVIKVLQKEIKWLNDDFGGYKRYFPNLNKTIKKTLFGRVKIK